MTIFRIHLLTALVGLGIGCNSFNPDLGASPFRCGTDSPRCPSGYSCVSYGPTEEVCERDGVVGERADAAPPGEPDARTLSCSSYQELEPNESIEDPTITGVPQQRRTLPLVGLAICPADDVDVFEFDIINDGADANVEISYRSQYGELQAELLNSVGTSVAVAKTVGNNVDLLRIAIPNLPESTYYVVVSAADVDIENTYSITISTDP